MSDTYSVGKEAYFVIEAEAVSDALARQIEAELEAITDTTWLRYSAPLKLTIVDGRLFASLTLWGDNYDFAIHVRALQQLARLMPELKIAVASDQDAFQPIDSRRLRAHVMRMIKPRPQWDGLYDKVVLTLPTTRLEEFRAALAVQIKRYEATPPPEHDGNFVRFQTDGSVRSINFVLSQCRFAVADVWPDAFPFVRVTLEGRESRAYDLRDGLGWLVMHSELAQAVGPVPPAA